MAICNKYKDIFDNFNNSSNIIKSSNRFKLINKRLYNILKFEDKLMEAESKLEKNL